MGLIMDARGRPMAFTGVKEFREWVRALHAYPDILSDQGMEGE
jgi:hypothetical protein